MPFQALDIAIDMIRDLKQPLARIAEHDAELAKQVRTAAGSVGQNLGEGRRRVGKDRLHLWRIAAGSADELMTSLRIAEAFGYVTMDDIRVVMKACDSVLAITWRLTH